MKSEPEKIQLPDHDYSKKWWSMLAVGMSVFMGTLDMSIVNVSLPTLVKQLHTDFPTIQWVILGYVLVVTSLMLGVARLGDMYSKKTLFIWGIIVFTIGSLLCGTSPGVSWLIAFRVIQGFGAVIMQALGAAIIVEIFPPYERGRAMGLIGTTVSIGIATGPALGGLIIGLIGWRWIFLINVPVGVITLSATINLVPSFSPRERNQRFDLIGALIMLVTLLCFALGMTLGQQEGFKNQMVLGLLFVAGAGVMIFLLTEKRVAQPMVELGLFRDMLFSLSLFMGFLSFITLGGTFLLPFFLELVKGYTPQKVGFLMMVTPVLMGIISPLSGSLSDRFGTRGISLIGLLMIFGGCLSISTLRADVTIMGYLLRVAPIGLGMGFFQSPNNSAIMGAVPPQRLGVASGLMALSRNLGQTAGIPLMGSIFIAAAISSAQFDRVTPITELPRQALVDGVTGTYSIAAYVILFSTILAVAGLWLDKKQTAVNGSHGHRPLNIK